MLLYIDSGALTCNTCYTMNFELRRQLVFSVIFTMCRNVIGGRHLLNDIAWNNVRHPRVQVVFETVMVVGMLCSFQFYLECFATLCDWINSGVLLMKDRYLKEDMFSSIVYIVMRALLMLLGLVSHSASLACSICIVIVMIGLYPNKA